MTDESTGTAVTGEEQQMFETLFEISQLLNTGMDRELLSTCTQLIDTGVNPEALAAVIKEIRRETSTSSRDMIAATTDKVRFYQENEDGSISHAFDLPPAAPDAKSGKGSEEEMNCPLTSMDWCDSDPNVIATSCLDATCTIWDLNEQRAQARIIAHSDEVFDVCWFPGDRHVFSTIGKDGSVRIFDLRNLEHSTIIFESDQYQPLCRLRWNKQDTNYLATFSMGTNTVSVLDLRMPGKAFCSLSSHSQPVTAIAWSPVARHQLCSTSEDHSCLVWNISYPTSTDEPAQASPTHEWTLGAPVQNVAWCANNSNLIAAGVENQLMIINI
eukprot:Clim_evm36s11 gene=Clim_evmTU36s11